MLSFLPFASAHELLIKATSQMPAFKFKWKCAPAFLLRIDFDLWQSKPSVWGLENHET